MGEGKAQGKGPKLEGRAETLHLAHGRREWGTRKLLVCHVAGYPPTLPPSVCGSHGGHRVPSVPLLHTSRLPLVPLG